MQITVDGIDLFAISTTQQQVIQNYLSSDIFDADIKRRLQWVLMHLHDQAFIGLKNQWDPILATRYIQVPTDPDAYAQLVFSQKDYLDRKGRDAAAVAANTPVVPADNPS